MLFNEIYSAYYNAVAKIIESILKGKTEEKDIRRIVCSNAFGESAMTVLPSLKGEKWQLVRGDMTTPIRHKPTMPLTLIQKRWLKAISLDPRIKLFGIEIDGLSDVEPLFTSEDYVVYDKYTDGDPYEDETYIKNFRTILSAMKHSKNLKLELVNRKGKTVYVRCIPERIEYSEKDDKFRLITAGCCFVKTVNISRITKCNIYNGDQVIRAEERSPHNETVTLRVLDERNALERSLLHFAHFEKRAERIDTNNYLLHIVYDKDDETELVIRILSFGPMMEVAEPARFRALIADRLRRQMEKGI